MKKTKRLIAIVGLLTLMALLISCTDARQSTEETVFSTEKTESTESVAHETKQPASATHSTEKEIIETHPEPTTKTPAETAASLEMLYYYSNLFSSTTDERAEELIRKVYSIETWADIAKEAIGREKDSFKNGVYHIASLNIDLKIPEGFYLYVIPGIYRDYEANLHTLQFVDEYVLTMREVTPEQLAEDIRTYRDKEHVRDKEAFRGPGYILYDFKVFHKDYQAVESFFTPEIRSNMEYRESGDYICRLGLCLWFLRDFENGPMYFCWHDGDLLDPEFSKNLMAGKYGGPAFISKDRWPVDQIIDDLCAGTKGSDNKYPHYDEEQDLFILESIQDYIIKPGVFIAGCPKMMFILSQDWLDYYKEAVAELKNNPEHHQYDEKAMGVISDRTGRKQDGWYTDTEKDVFLRAVSYANSRASGWDCSVDNIIIKLLDHDGVQYFEVYLKVDDPGAEIPFPDSAVGPTTMTSKLFRVGYGINWLGEENLLFARQYLLEQLGVESALVSQEYWAQLYFEEGVLRQSLSNEERDALENYFRIRACQLALPDKSGSELEKISSALADSVRQLLEERAERCVNYRQSLKADAVTVNSTCWIQEVTASGQKKYVLVYELRNVQYRAKGQTAFDTYSMGLRHSIVLTTAPVIIERDYHEEELGISLTNQIPDLAQTYLEYLETHPVRTDLLERTAQEIRDYFTKLFSDGEAIQRWVENGWNITEEKALDCLTIAFSPESSEKMIIQMMNLRPDYMPFDRYTSVFAVGYEFAYRDPETGQSFYPFGTSKYKVCFESADGQVWFADWVFQE